MCELGRNHLIQRKITRTSPIALIGKRGGPTVPTPDGKIVSAWKRDGENILVSLSLPKGATAAVSLPGLKRMKTVSGKHQWIIKER